MNADTPNRYIAIRNLNTRLVHARKIGDYFRYPICGSYLTRLQSSDIGKLSDFRGDIITCKSCVRILRARGVIVDIETANNTAKVLLSLLRKDMLDADESHKARFNVTRQFCEYRKFRVIQGSGKMRFRCHKIKESRNSCMFALCPYLR